MADANLRQSSRFLPLKSAANTNVGLYIRPNKPLALVNLGYSFTDTASKFTTTSTAQSRIALIRGPFGDLVSNFSLAYSLEGYQIIGDYFINDFGPGNLQFSADSDEQLIQPGDGATLLVLAPIITGNVGSTVVASVFASTSLRTGGQFALPGAGGAAGGGASGGGVGGAGGSAGVGGGGTGGGHNRL